MLRCFVAMRIGEPELDRLLDRAIIPTLRAAGVRGVRVDRIVHNDDVDDRIIHELDRADLVLADLTFARPSVYFEAGWADGVGKPVIYTCRRDHLHPKEDDELGNLRVHFDLQMKNIITWSSPSDRTFARRLDKRVRLLSRPIQMQRDREARVREEHAAFERRSVRDRLAAVLDIGARKLRAAGFSGTHLKSGEGIGLMPVYGPKEPFAFAWSGAKRMQGGIEGAFISLYESLTQSRLRDCAQFVASAPPHDMNPRPSVRPKAVREHIVLCSLRTVPDSRVASSLTQYEQLGPGHFIWWTKQVVPTRRVGNQPLFVTGTPLPEAIRLRFGAGKRSPARYRYQGEALVERIARPTAVFFASSSKKPRPEPAPGHRIPTRIVPRLVHLYVLSNVRSEADFKEALVTKVLPVVFSKDDISLAARKAEASTMASWYMDTGL